MAGRGARAAREGEGMTHAWMKAVAFLGIAVGAGGLWGAFAAEREARAALESLEVCVSMQEDDTMDDAACVDTLARCIEALPVVIFSQEVPSGYQ